MKTPIILKEKVDVNITEEVMSFIAKVGTVAGAMIGIWALTALVAGLTSAGPLGLIRGYITAITGF